MNRKKYAWAMAILVALALTPFALPTPSALHLSSQFGRGALHPLHAPETPETTPQQAVTAYGNLPLAFEPNHGQTDPQVHFLARGPGYTLFLTPTEAVLALVTENRNSPIAANASGHGFSRAERAEGKSGALAPEGETSSPTVLRMKLVGANPAPRVTGLDALPGKSNYFLGNDPTKWRTNIPHYAKVRYEDVYPGMDLIFYSHPQRVTNHESRITNLEFDFIVAPGADPSAIRLAFEGADKLELDPHGNLIILPSVHGARSTMHALLLHQPRIYQERPATSDPSATLRASRRPVAGGYVLTDNDVGFQVGPYDADRPLIIDPVLSYSTYLGGTSSDIGEGIAVDAAGNAYVTGETFSTNFPTASPVQAATGGFADAFVAKLNPSGSALVYSTYLGGTGQDQGSGIAIDPAGNAYVTGFTLSTNFPTTPGPFQPACNVALGFCQDAFVTKLNPAGSALLFSTYLGGNSGDETFSIAVDPAGNAYVTGRTFSTNFPTTPGAFQTTCVPFFFGLCHDTFVTKLNSAGSALVYSTYLGGGSPDGGGGIAVDAAGNAYVTGFTGSTNFPTATPLQATLSGSFDAFVTKVNATGSALLFSTYLGGTGSDAASGIAVDPAGNAYVTGITSSSDFPTANPLQPTFGGVTDAFVTKVDTTGSVLLFSTYLGGTAQDQTFSIAVDPAGNAYVTGLTVSTDFPTANPFQAANAGGQDGFVTKLNPAGSALVFSTYLGGSIFDRGEGIAVDPAGNAFVTGVTASTNFPTATPLQTANAGGADAFVAKLAPVVAIEVEIDIKPSSDPNAINPRGRGLIPVAILTTANFDATTVSPSTVQFGPAGASLAHRSGHLEDVDADGDLDLVLHFRTQETSIACGDTQASLTGETFGGQSLQGSDSILTVGCR